jgi:hypothetical protein
MHVAQPIRMLKRLCPHCGQGSSLVLVSCPACGRLALECDEEASIFDDPRNPSQPVPGETPCRGCGRVALADFIHASDEAIRAHGFSEEEIELV